MIETWNRLLGSGYPEGLDNVEGRNKLLSQHSTLAFQGGDSSQERCILMLE
jgi:hypothetical protein